MFMFTLIASCWMLLFHLLSYLLYEDSYLSASPIASLPPSVIVRGHQND